MNVIQMMPKWVWWVKGECVVEVLGAGHYPTSIMVKLPNDKITEIECDDIENHRQ
jgi:hypothetical protein